ncbi:MAG: sodium-dependent transporter [bacterium]|nr:sodium-dependent transporter [Gammaproteobacteria bacterium]HIL98349.1 sodium-dependent transporter [Pseudomonadales bacterium]
MAGSESIHGMWSSRLMFILAAAGSAVGLGNIWRFPYVVGEYGGGAFVLVYLACIFLIGIPIMSSEILLGRAGRQSPINTMRELTMRSGANPAWQVVGWMGALAGFLILSFYGVIAGWAMAYVVELGSGVFSGADAETAGRVFAEFTGDVWQVVFWHGLFMLITIFIVARGVSEGLEKTVKYLMPALFVLLLVLVGYSMTTGYFMDGLKFLFSFNFDKLGWNSVLIAMGQAFFTLSLGMGAIMTYGAYMPKGTSIIGAATSIALIDTGIALLAGMAIFPLVFANGLESSSGPGLMFVTLPLAFGQMGGGVIFGAVFFVLVTFAAITSAISLVEPALAWLVERMKVSRLTGAMIVGGVAWLLGMGSAFSTNIWVDVTVLPGMNFFDSMDYISNNIMLPLGGIVIALFSGWVIDKKISQEELDLTAGQFRIWEILVRFISPAAVGFVFVMTFA